MRRRIAHGLMIAFLVIGLGAAQGPNNSEASSAPDKSAQIKPEVQRQAKSQPYQVGTASWYGEDFEGKTTASGEDYEMYDMTAAHPTLPLGSYVRVTNLQNGRSVHAQGLSVPELADAIKTAYAGTLHNPIVNVDLKDFQKPFFTVSGQVGKPGQYDLRADITVAEAIAIAGGLAPTAKSQIFLFHRTSDQWFEVKKVNLKDVMHGKNLNEDAILKPGDMIFVPETFITSFRKYVPYSVNAGTYFSNPPF